MRILDRINGHSDLAALNPEQQEQLCCEIRDFLVSHVAKTGGHLASNLGVVELTVALETVFDTNKDRLVFDVGHQSYVHKLLTGRQTDFARLRQFGGIAGFPKPSESNSDAFVAGHASSSVSIALGMARARTLQNEDYHVISLIGDGAATGGMAYEGLNDAADSSEPMVIVLNDNEMSIDRNVGGMARHLARLRTKERYLGAKEWYRNLLFKIPGGKGIYRWTRSVKEWFKRVVLPTSLFENMGLTYLGPVDGHDLQELIRIFCVARDMKRPVLVHVITQKGHGYKFAEEAPSKFHGVGKFDPDSGEVPAKNSVDFSAAFGQRLCELAQVNSKICAITAAMPAGTGLLGFKEAFPNRLFDVGIAEEHAVSMAGGLAKQGMIPVVALYSTFLQRAYDQLLQDIAMLKLHVVFAVDRAGLVGEDGETHHGVFDAGFLRQIPGMTVLCPASCAELGEMLRWAVEDWDGPVAIRYPRGGDRSYTGSDWDQLSDFGIVSHRCGADVTLLTYGTLLDNVMEAADKLASMGIEATVLRLMKISPLLGDRIMQQMAPNAPLIIVEETMANCGICGALTHEICVVKPEQIVSGMDLGHEYVTHGSVNELYFQYGLDSNSIVKRVLEVLQSEN